MSFKDINILLRNNTGNKTKSNLIDGFVVRTKQHKSIFSEIKQSKKDKPEQNYLIIGQRGAGKTTLLYRLKYAIEDDEELKSEIIPIMFSEEQYNLMDLENLWESIGEHLEGYNKFQTLRSEMNNVQSDKKEEILHKLLEERLKENGKKIIVFIENIDVFFKKIVKDQQRLYKILKTSSRIRLICSSTTFFDGIVDESDPFFGFFKVYQLEGLTRQESEKLIKKFAEQRNETSQMQQILIEHPKRLESLRRLTGGNPRIISYLFQIFQDNENGKAILDLYKLLDDITYLYKAELDLLSPQKQKIIDVMARNWDAIATKDISSRINLDSKHVSSILKALEKDQVVESINTKTKNNLYRIKDRFLNIWYLMRFGKKRDQENIVWLVRFYDAWCDHTELSKRINSLIKELDSGQYDVVAALDMGNVFLSCKNVSPEVKYSLYKKTKSVLPKGLIKDLKLTDGSLYESIRGLVKKRDFDGAFEALAEIKSQENKSVIESWIYFEKKDYQKAIDSLEELYKLMPGGELALQIGTLYDGKLSSPDKALEFFALALEQEDWRAAEYIGQIHYYEKDDIATAEKYLRMAIEHNVDGALMNLAKMFFDENRLEDSESLVLTAIDKGEKEIKNNLALIYQEQGELDKAISVYEEAVADGEVYAMINLGELYMNGEEFKPEQARVLFEQAIQKNVNKAYSLLGKLYLKQDNYAEAERVLLEGIENEDALSAHVLGHHYEDLKDWNKAEEFFLKSANLGRISSLICLFESYFQEGINSKKLDVLKHFETYMEEIEKETSFMIVYARLLLWNDQVDKSLAMIGSTEDRMTDIFYGTNAEGEFEGNIIAELIIYFVTLISKRQFNAAYDLFQNSKFDFKQVLKPVYFALMKYMQKEYPNEYLKAGDELKETIEEVVKNIEEFKKLYN